MENATNNDITVSAIDKAIAAAKARAAGKAKPADKPPVDAVRPTSEERQALRAEAKAKRDAERAERKAAKVTPRAVPVHMTKVQKAAGRLPSLSQEIAKVFDEVTTNFGREQITALSLHLQHHNRVSATIKATVAQPLKVGQVVRIVGGDPKFYGMTGALDRVQRIRCYVSVPGTKRPVYCFTSDVEVVNEEGSSIPTSNEEDEPAATATGTEG